MIRHMRPELCPGRYVFAGSDDPALAARALATFREDEGLSLILPEEVAREAGLPADLPMRRITLRVHSALDGIGLTAAVSGALTEAGIACNVVAALHHDHVFVPAPDATRALAALEALSDG
ncbi:ACT domain-containing protein [Roseivivax sediminis]|uniref:Uncharacterized protein n=1 Tax=Roseivivax sediminis TaxID=936889 RepID=A0A1I1UBU7_9RHOB|nr:ACT domain-containing protein [Roseivivax sediminis]SFD65420.1 hypothetical protein SAMN04515678_102136 [Roseivivax sediminis]